MNNRLQFRHHTPIFDSREEAIDYIYRNIKNATEGLAYEDDSFGYSLFAEPTILRYKNEADDELPSGSTPNPHLILAIGSNTNEGRFHSDNRFCIIDIDKTEKEIEDLWEQIEEISKGLTIITKNTNTLKLYSERTDDGNVISGDVVVAETQIFDDIRRPNTLLNTSDGLFTFVKLEYEPGDDKFTFFVNGDKKIVPLCDYYIIRGYYSKRDESLHLIRKDGIDIKVSLENLIDEWGVEGEATNTPIVLTKEEVGYGDDAQHNHVEPYQDLLKADVRLSDRKYNILKKTSDGRYLYVDGLASNIVYFKDGEEISVQDALRQATRGISNDSTNIIYEKADGYYATAQLRYSNRENKLIFTTSNVTGGTSVEEIKLNAVEAFTKIYYDSVTESLVIMYKDGSGDIQEVDVPIGQMMQDWEWDIQNEGHNVKLHKQRVVAGNDKVSADVAIYNDPDNILVDKNHELFVKGTADNIKYGRDGNVSDELDKLNSADANISGKINEISGKVETVASDLDAEIARSTNEDEMLNGKIDSEIERSVDKDNEIEHKADEINEKIGTGFGTNFNETVTYKFNELSAKTDAIEAVTNELEGKIDVNTTNIALISAKTDSEIARAISEEERIERKFDDELGEGFNARNTVRDEIEREKSARIATDENLQEQIDAIEVRIDEGVREVVNYDHSIVVDKSEQGKSIISANISEERINGVDNIIKLNNDGLYVGVDLDYHFESGTSKNVLVFKTTNGTKVFDLKTNSVVDNIYYDPAREAIIIEYTVDGHRMPDVVVPVGDLIDEWRVSENTSGAIKLNKFRDSSARQDILSAETIISLHEDNILINDNGALYVSGAQIAENKNNISALVESMTSVEGDIDSIENGLAEEITRATSEEQRIEAKLDSEIERSNEEDDEIWAALRAEITRSTNKDNEHDSNIANEIQRASLAERDLHDEIISEKNNRVSADTILDNKIDREIVNARAEEGRIEDRLNQEISRSTEKDNEHNSAINALRSDLSNEVSARISNDNEIKDSIHQEEDRAKSAESAITHSIQIESIARQNGDDNLNQKISTEIANRANADSLLQSNLDNEASSRIGEDNRIEAKIDAEISRSTNKDNDLQLQITTEATTARSAESSLRESLTAEIANRQTSDASLQTQISNEIQRAQGVENTLSVKIDNEKEARENEDSKIWAKIRPIEFHDTTTIHNERVRQSGETPDEIRHYVVVSQSNNNIVVADDVKGGVYATVSLDYVESTNTVVLKGTDGMVLSTQQLGPGSLLDSISYDYEEKSLVIDYHSADGVAHSLKFPVSQLFNEWDVRNLSQGSALELHKETNSGGTGNVDVLWGKVLIASAVEHPDGTVNYGDNIIRIVGNGLYASGAAIIEAKDTADCTKNELRRVETAVLGTDLSVNYICGEGYEYTPYSQACFINAATSMFDADKILDTYLCSAHTRINNVEDNVACLKQELNVTQENVIGLSIPECGLNIDGTPYRYKPYEGACIINGATSIVNAIEILDTTLCNIGGSSECAQLEVKKVENVLGANVQGACSGLSISYPATSGCILYNARTYAEADAALESAICSLDVNISGGSTPTADIVTDNRAILANVRLSHGNDSGKWQTDSELKLSTLNDDEFSDTNVLKIANVYSEDADSNYNGLYLSNVWDCGEYTENGVGTPNEMYRIDDSETAQNNFDRRYRNGVRYTN